MNEGDDAPAIKHREAVFWLFSGRDRIGMLKLSEYDLETGVYWDEFFTWADGLEQQAGDMVEAMHEAFGNDNSFVTVSDYGSIIFAKAAWIAPAWRTRTNMRGVFDAAIDALCPDHAAIFLIAYPQTDDNEEEDNLAGGDIEDLGDWQWRQRALSRLYQRTLGFQMMPTKEARDCIMWRPRASVAHWLKPTGLAP